MKLIVGLGNPGEKYIGTRHNLGFMAVDEYIVDNLAVKDSGKIWKNETKFKAETAKLETLDILLIKPQTFMNLSGEAVKRIMNYFKIPITDLIVIHDDLDLPLGRIKVRVGGSAGGHHGVESIIADLKDDKFTRVRLGIGNIRTASSEHGGAHINTEHFVLEEFTSTERPKVRQMLKKAVGAVASILNSGVEIAQNQYN